jgi:hypothetical protein
MKPENKSKPGSVESKPTESNKTSLPFTKDDLIFHIPVSMKLELEDGQTFSYENLSRQEREAILETIAGKEKQIFNYDGIYRILGELVIDTIQA